MAISRTYMDCTPFNRPATTATVKALFLPRLILGRITRLRVECFIRPTIGKAVTHDPPQLSRQHGPRTHPVCRDDAAKPETAALEGERKRME